MTKITFLNNFLKILAFSLLCINSLLGQSQYDIRMVFDTLDCVNKVGCYNVQIRSADGNEWGLAGQNYRLYYDASLAAYQSGISTLPSGYQDFSLIQDEQDVDASSTGSNLSFEGTLGFLNYTMDLSNPSVGGTTVPADGTWLTTSQLCFTLEDALLDNPGTCLEVIWARDTLTADYATSFVEISEWVQSNSTQMAEGVGYDDLDASDGQGACFDNACNYDYGDLPDSSALTNASDYQTLVANNGPRHVIIPGLHLGNIVDAETDGLQSTDALGDGADEDGLTIFESLNLVSGITFGLPLSYVNTTGNPAHIEAWIDWNNNGEFDVGEMVLDVTDPSSGLYDLLRVTVPPDAVTGEFLGLRIRISNQDNMTPYGLIDGGEVEDYLLSLDCPTQICVPIQLNIIRPK